MDQQARDLYFVAVKLLLRDGDKLLITHDIFGDWDLPGGRIRVEEFNKPLESVIGRKINEELGSEVTYELGEPQVFFRVERIEKLTPGFDGKQVRIFAVGYEATYKGGNIQLGEHHDQLKWVEIGTFKPEKYFKNTGWLKGIQEYLEKLS